MRRVLITGALGFTGRHLSACLRERGGVYTAGTSRRDGRDHGLDEMRVVDPADAASVERVVADVRPDAVFHLAGLNSGTPDELRRANVTAAAVVLEAVRRHAPEARVLLVGSAAEYGLPTSDTGAMRESDPCRPVSPYGASKLAATEAALHAAATGLRVTVVRPFNIVGRGMPATLVLGAVLARARAALAQGRDTVAVGRLDTARDFVAVEDVVEAYIRLIDAEAVGMIVNVCSGEPRPVGAVVEALLAHAPRPLRPVEDATLVRPGDVPVAFGCNDLVRGLVGFQTWTPLDVTLARAWADE